MSKPLRVTQEMIDDYSSAGYWKNETTSTLWDRNAELLPEKEALVDSKQRLTWSQIKEMSDRMALGLIEMGFKRDDLLFILLPNCVESYVTRIAAEKAGVLVMTALMTIRDYEIEYMLRNYEVKGVIIPRQFRSFDYFSACFDIQTGLPCLEHIIVLEDNAPEGIISLKELMATPLPTRFAGNTASDSFIETRYQPMEVSSVGLTSGTTGMPKVAEYPICAGIFLGDMYHQMPKLNSDDTVLNVLNAVGGLGRTFSFCVPREGAKIVLQEVWNAQEALQIIEMEKVTVMLCAPAQMAILVQQENLDQFDLSSLRALCSSTSALGSDLIKTAEKKLNTLVANVYGAFDGGGICQTTIDDDDYTRHHTVGKPFPGYEIKLIDEDGVEVAQGEEGELCFRGPGTSSGYFRDEGLTKKTWGCIGKEGLFKTGDLAQIDSAGNITITGRKKDVIVRGGQNIYPVEIEGLLSLHKAIRQVALVHMPDRIMGEKACAYVSLHPGAHFDFEEMISFLKRKKIAPYKLHERLEIWDELPTRGEKISKVELCEDIANKLKAEGGR